MKKKLRSVLRNMKKWLKKVVAISIMQFSGGCFQFRVDALSLLIQNLSCLGIKLQFEWIWILLIEFGNVILDVIHLYCPIVACINAKYGILFSIYCYIEVSFHDIFNWISNDKMILWSAVLKII
jgi:hypothetical protein